MASTDSLIPTAGDDKHGAAEKRKTVNKAGAPTKPALESDNQPVDDPKRSAARVAVASGLTYVDGIIAVVLLVLAAVTRFHRIEDPRSVIFDEAHFNKFTTWYISRHYYVDIHPPLAKLVFAAVLWVLGFVGAQEDKIGAS